MSASTGYALGRASRAISAGEGHGRFAAAIAAAYVAAPQDDDADAPARPINIAIIGRPNAGKSTLVNALIGQDRLLVGPEAGITRDAIAVDWNWNGKRYRLVDTAGMRRKAKVQQKLERLSVSETLHAIRFADVCVLVMDAHEAFEKQDLSIGDLVVREGRALVFALSKWDQMEDPPAAFEELKLKARESLPQARGAPLVTIAALAGVGLDRLMEAVDEAHEDWTARVKTRISTIGFYASIAKHPPPAVRGKRIKPRYLTQIKARPPTFVLISSRADDMPEATSAYLVNARAKPSACTPRPSASSSSRARTLRRRRKLKPRSSFAWRGARPRFACARSESPMPRWIVAIVLRACGRRVRYRLAMIHYGLALDVAPVRIAQSSPGRPVSEAAGGRLGCGRVWPWAPFCAHDAHGRSSWPGRAWRPISTNGRSCRA